MIPALLVEALKDKRLRGAPFTVLCYLHAVLELGEYRTVKHWVVAQELGITRQRASQAIGTLVETGYLRAGDTTARNVRSYMLLTSRGEPVRQSA
jgi:predicted transcriptional regulator